MALKERPLPSPDDVFRTIEENLPKYLPPYKNLDPKDRSREMQKAAFGDNAIEVSDAEYDKLIKIVRELRPWLRINGKNKDEHTSYQGTNHEIFWLEETGESTSHSISFEPRPWEQSAGKFKEPYPKFSLSIEDSTRTIDFSINFDDTYSLVVKNKPKQITFEIDGLRRSHMTVNEYKVVKYAVETVSSHFDIPM